VTDGTRISAVARVLGQDFVRLPPEVRAVHSGLAVRVTGRADVERGIGPIKRAICALLGFPRDGRGQPVTIKFSTGADCADHWERDFGGRRYASFLAAGSGRHAGYLVERLGFFTIVFRLAADDGRLVFRMVGLCVVGIPVPTWLRPSCVAFEGGRNGEFTFDITVDLPLIGRLIRYRGAMRKMG